MEEPPRYQTANKTAPQDPLPLPMVAPDGQQRYLPEVIEPNGNGNAKRIVHLDLDPSNGKTYCHTLTYHKEGSHPVTPI